ncbi:ParA family protein [Mucispirillum schaedleri]|uniref:ParA family protein n=1 Tax=Mucispirillum schaedleri TaxID=248039 RepID=UPI001F562E74|nr:ParA family protein [Mucispirillum schaedleri]
MTSYVIWNNKGGIGKTMLSFLLSTEYALQYPDKNIVVVDMCPQANVSQVLLGGSDNVKNYQEIIKSKKTVADYIINRIEKTPYQKAGNEALYYVNPSEYNSQIPSNIFLIPGSSKLEILNQSIDTYATALSVGEVQNWKAVYNWLNDLKDGIINTIGENTVFFIDTNPSFANYTKMAILSANRLIIPCFADVGSLLAIQNLMYFLYDIKSDSIAVNMRNDFVKNIKEYNMSLPLIYMLIVGRSTMYNEKAAAAFKFVEENIEKTINDYKKQNNGTVFVNSNFKIVQKLRDLNSVAPLINVKGELLSNMKGGQPTDLYTDSGTQMRIPTNIKDFQQAVKDIVHNL